MPPKKLNLNHLPRAFQRGFRRSVASETKSIPVAATDTDSATAPDQDRFLVLESCHSTWLFDDEARRFCRVLKGDLTSAVSTEWREYDRLVLDQDSEAFVVFLDKSGTRLLRSWRHTSHCERCGGEVTTEMSIDDLRRLVNA